MAKNYMSPLGHKDELDCARWACLANAPAILTADFQPDADLRTVAAMMLLAAGWTEADLKRALSLFSEVWCA